uniref:EB domain-containing protein n=1 Tax=Rhabditophanes sp. KR3021 TaxID=114890 RepID=A0AC35TXA1_9BILA
MTTLCFVIFFTLFCVVTSYLGLNCRQTNECGDVNLFCHEGKCRRANCDDNLNCQTGELCFFGKVNAGFRKACFAFDLTKAQKIVEPAICPGGGTAILVDGVYESCDFVKPCAGNGICNPNNGVCCSKIRTCPLPTKPMLNQFSQKPIMCRLKSGEAVECGEGARCHPQTGFCCLQTKVEPALPDIIINISETAHTLVGEACSPSTKPCGSGSSCECDRSNQNCLCQCMKEMGYLLDYSGKNCLRIRKKVNEFCSSDIECGAAFSTCQHNKCQCKNGFESDSRDGCKSSMHNCINDEDPYRERGQVKACTVFWSRSVYYSSEDAKPTKFNSFKPNKSTNLSLFEMDDDSSSVFNPQNDDTGCPHDFYCVAVFEVPKSPHLYEGFCCPTPKNKDPVCPVGENCPFDQYYCHIDRMHGTKEICCPKPCISPDDVYIEGQCQPTAFYGERCFHSHQCMGQKKLSGINNIEHLLDAIGTMECMSGVCGCPTGWIHEEGACKKLECKVGWKGDPQQDGNGNIVKCGRSKDCSQGLICDPFGKFCCRGVNKCPGSFVETGENCSPTSQCFKEGDICIVPKNKTQKICCTREG